MSHLPAEGIGDNPAAAAGGYHSRDHEEGAGCCSRGREEDLVGSIVELTFLMLLSGQPSTGKIRRVRFHQVMTVTRSIDEMRCLVLRNAGSSAVQQNEQQFDDSIQTQTEARRLEGL